mgnify:FL=1
MNNIFKSAFILLVGVLGLSLTACTEKYEYPGPGENADGKAYFEQSSQKIQLTQDANSFKIPVKRLSADGALEVPVTFEAGTGNIFTVSNKAVFEAGKTEGYIQVTYNIDDVKMGKYVGGKITLDPTYVSPYGSGTFTFVAGSTEFGASVWKKIGTGVLTISDPDNDLGHFFNKQGEKWLLLDNPAQLSNRVLYQNTENPQEYKIEPYIKDGFAMTFTVNSETNRIFFKDVDTGLRDQNKAVVYANCLEVLVPGAEDKINKPSVYDKANKTLTFSTAYTGANAKGIYAVEMETFVYE